MNYQLSILLVLSFVQSVAVGDGKAFALRDGDRVVLLGNTLIERSQRYGYWEAMLTSAFPNRHITFRNLGWSGDTVWAESRGIFDPPAKGYERMLAQVKELRPTVILLGYGNNESFAGKAGLPRFLEQLSKLVADLKTAAEGDVRFVVVSPTAHEIRPHIETAEANNQRLKVYRDALAEFAESGSMPFVDLLTKVNVREDQVPPRPAKPWYDAWFHENSQTLRTVNGVNLNRDGYRAATEVIRQSLAISDPAWKLRIAAEGKPRVERAEVRDVQLTESGLKFQLRADALPTCGTAQRPADAGVLHVTGLADGKYELHVEGKRVAEQRGEQAFHVTTGGDARQAEQLRAAIIEKNRLYFYRWRPQNVTYLFLFRKHEQGQNAKELPEFDKLIDQQEQKIAKLRQPQWREYELKRVIAGE